MDTRGKVGKLSTVDENSEREIFLEIRSHTSDADNIRSLNEDYSTPTELG